VTQSAGQFKVILKTSVVVATWHRLVTLNILNLRQSQDLTGVLTAMVRHCNVSAAPHFLMQLICKPTNNAKRMHFVMITASWANNLIFFHSMKKVLARYSFITKAWSSSI